MPTIKLSDLEMALEWTSANMDNAAWVCRETGRIYWETADPGALGEEEELPDDIHDESKYAPVPSKYDLDLGNQLAYDFTRQFLPDDYDVVRDIFRRSGAWARFKNLLADKDLLERWYAWSGKRNGRAGRVGRVQRLRGRAATAGSAQRALRSRRRWKRAKAFTDDRHA